MTRRRVTHLQLEQLCAMLNRQQSTHTYSVMPYRPGFVWVRKEFTRMTQEAMAYHPEICIAPTYLRTMRMGDAFDDLSRELGLL